MPLPVYSFILLLIFIATYIDYCLMIDAARRHYDASHL